MRLQYEISADASQLKRVLRGVEQEAKASNRRIARERQETMFGPVERPRAAYGPDRKAAVQARRYEEAQARSLARAQQSLDRQRSQALLANVRAEERERMRADKNAASAAQSLDRQRASGLMQQLREQERAQARAYSQRRRTAERIGTGAASSVSRGIGTVARVGGAALGLLGGFSAAGALEEQFAIKRQASQVALSAGAPGEKGALEREALGVKGFTGSETLGALGGFVQKTGDLGAGRADIQTLGQLALASSSDFGEMGEAAGQAFNVIRDTIKDPVKQVEALNEVMRALVGQGQLGAVEIKDMTTELAGLGAASRSFQGGPVELLKTMGAMAQASVARGGARDAAEATTSVTRFAADLTKHPAQKALAGLGVNVFADKGRTILKDPREIMGDILSKTGGDLVKVEEVLNAESKKALAGFAPLFLAAEKQKKGTGRQAIKDEFVRLNSATPSMDEINKRAALRLEDPDMQIKETMKQFNAAIGNELLPAVTRIIPKFSEAIPALARFTGSVADLSNWLLDNPIKGVGAVILASVTKDVASAGLGSLISRLLVAAFAGQAAGAAGGAAAGAGGLATGAAGAAGGVGLALGGAIAAAIGGTVAAGYEAYELTNASGGLAGVGAGIGGVLAGRGYAGGVDDYMNEQARQDTWTPGKFGRWFDDNPSGRGDMGLGRSPALPPETPMAEQVKQLFGTSTKDLQSAAKDISTAAQTLKANAGANGRDPRGAPIKPG